MLGAQCPAEPAPLQTRETLTPARLLAFIRDLESEFSGLPILGTPSSRGGTGGDGVVIPRGNSALLDTGRDTSCAHPVRGHVERGPDPEDDCPHPIATTAGHDREVSEFMLSSRARPIAEESTRLAADARAQSYATASQDVYDLVFVREIQEVCTNGWVERCGYSCRAISRKDAIRCAISAMVARMMLYPVSIWLRGTSTPSRDSFIELNRAIPAFSFDDKMRACTLLRTRMGEYLRAWLEVRDVKERLAAEKRDNECSCFAFDRDEVGASVGDEGAFTSDDKFAFVLRASQKHTGWHNDLCAGCNKARCDTHAPIIVMYPCAHVICGRPECLGARKHCPCCETAVASLRIPIIVDSTLEVPCELIDGFAQVFASANIFGQ
jgi:hypothetical protein